MQTFLRYIMVNWKNETVLYFTRLFSLCWGFWSFAREWCKPPDGEKASQDDIWGLFKEAQRSKLLYNWEFVHVFNILLFPKALVETWNLLAFVSDFFFLSCFLFLVLNGISDILFLNKQRLKAVEELNKTNRERELLLEKIDVLEAEKQAGFRKGDSNLIACCPWLTNG